MTEKLNSERFTIDAVAEKLEVHPATVWRWVTTGVKGRKLESFLIGGRRYVTGDGLDAFCGDSEQVREPKRAREAARDASKKLDGLGVKKR